MEVTLSKAPDQAISDYTITMLQFCGFYPISSVGLVRVYQSQFNLQDQATSQTVQQHLSLGIAALYLMEHGIKVSLSADSSEKFAVISAMSLHKHSHCLFGDNVAIPALSMLA